VVGKRKVASGVIIEWRSLQGGGEVKPRRSSFTRRCFPAKEQYGSFR
jgi:hypothetical protein